MKWSVFLAWVFVAASECLTVDATGMLVPSGLRCEYLEEPMAVESARPRLSWSLRALEDATGRELEQSAYQVVVSATEAGLLGGGAELWDSGKVQSSEMAQIAYGGRTLAAGEECWWRVRVWDGEGGVSGWSEPGRWCMGLMGAASLRAEWISYRDNTPVHASREELYLPAARHYRKEFTGGRGVRRAVAYVSALGLVDLHLNGHRVGEGYFEPGWSDYHRRAYYRAHDVTGMVREGGNCIGAVVAEGWYSGYVGYGLLVGYGPNRAGRYFYGKTPALWVQLEVEYLDGSREVVVSDSSWRVTGDGPIREADLLMGESYDARRELGGWDLFGYDDGGWNAALQAGENGAVVVVSHDNRGRREVDLGFREPLVMQSYMAPPIRVTQELKARGVAEPEPGVYVVDLGQNFAGVIRLRLRGEAGQRVRLRYGEMLHADGRLMTENLRRARATDYYTFRGDPRGEVWEPRFTYHGFQYVEITGLKRAPDPDAVTGLVLHNDTPLVGEFECSDEVLTQFWKNTQWTQRANFIEMPTDCPQRDERLGWMGDAQVYVRAATYNADVAAFFTKWLDDVEEAQREFGAYPDYCPYPMGHGAPGKTFGTAWMDAGVICPWTIWQVYGDVGVIERHWDSMRRFMDWRQAVMKPGGLGVSIGNDWGDWLNVNESTPIEYVDVCYHALTCRMMMEMAAAVGREVEAADYRDRLAMIRQAFNREYLLGDGRLKVETQTAYVLAIWVGLLPEDQVGPAAMRLAGRIETNGFRMATGFLGTKPLLPVLTSTGHHDLAVGLFQSREFPSWGYEVVNGANSVWERWDSYTLEHGFNGQSGNQNAAMNSFSHYSFGAVTEWIFRDLVGIDTDGPGFRGLVLRPGVPGENVPVRKGVEPLSWVKASYASPGGMVRVEWKKEGRWLEYRASIPVNTRATLYLPGRDSRAVEIRLGEGEILREEAGKVVVRLHSGDHELRTELGEGY
ncbi:MAG: alfa-L-rhamnosidase [Verrucomicrobiota bacterium]